MLSLTKKYLFVFLLLSPQVLFASSKGSEKSLKKFLKAVDFYSRSNVNYLKKGRVIATSEAKESDDEQRQSIWLKLAGFHQKKCTQTLTKISQYENYSKLIGFVESSSYEKGEANFALKIIFDKPFKAKVKIARVSKVGSYPFTLSSGFIKGMKGVINVEEWGERCFLFARLDWEGPRTSLSNFFMETFFNTIGKLGLEKLFLLTGHRAD